MYFLPRTTPFRARKCSLLFSSWIIHIIPVAIKKLTAHWATDQKQSVAGAQYFSIIAAVFIRIQKTEVVLETVKQLLFKGYVRTYSWFCQFSWYVFG